MAVKPNQTEEGETTLYQRSVQLPGWMWRQIGEIADRDFGTRSQVVRRLLTAALERELGGGAS